MAYESPSKLQKPHFLMYFGMPLKKDDINVLFILISSKLTLVANLSHICNYKPFYVTTNCFYQVSQPYFGQVWGWSPPLGKSENLESSGTPECLELNNRTQNTSHWGVLGVIEKVLTRRYRKWPRIGHLDIFRPSYGQKKGRESNWQFDSRPLKVMNRYLPDLQIASAIRRWKDLNEGYKFGSDLVAIWSRSRELWAPKVLGLHPGQFRDNFGTPIWESREK